MPRLTRYFIKAGLAYLVLALLVGVLMTGRTMLNLPLWINALYPVSVHLLMVGWVTQLIMGVAHWMFPKYSKEQPRRNERLAWAVFVMLNAGLLLRVIGEPLTVNAPDLNMGWLLVVSAVLQLAAGWGFVFNMWSRVKER
jgi:heme/copper-type cytochrome/quinol oxidase subunit 1